MSITPAPWTIKVLKTKYPDLFTYTVLGVNTTPDASYSGAAFTVASELDSLDDARLIAAAPDLLFACDLALQDYMADNSFVDRDTMMSTLRAAIAMASGYIRKAKGG